MLNINKLNTLIDDTKLNQIQNFYKDKFDSIENINYSFTEQKTNVKWLDGKDIYQITLGNGTTNLVGTHDISNLNIDQIIDMQAIGSDNDNNGYPRWVMSMVSSSNSRLIYLQDVNTLICTGNFRYWYITLKYTKNT